MLKSGSSRRPGVGKSDRIWNRSAGFSLVEILVTVGIIVTLIALVVPISKGWSRQAESVREMAGARRSIAAWVTYSGENDGKVLPGYSDSADPDLSSVTDQNGQALDNITSRRYVYRLAPYLGFDLQGSLLVNSQAHLKGSYEVSMQPSFGMNITFVGGDYGTFTRLNPKTKGEYVVKTLAQIQSPSRLIVFASARITDASFKPRLSGTAFGQREGYNAVIPPYVSSRVWVNVPYTEKRPYYDFGNLHLRYRNRAVCTMADGHTELLDYEQLSDMRRWANNAAVEDNPGWVVP